MFGGFRNLYKQNPHIKKQREATLASLIVIVFAYNTLKFNLSCTSCSNVLGINLAYTFSVTITLLCPINRLILCTSTPRFNAQTANVCLLVWNRTHRAAVSKQVTIKRNPFEMSGFALFCRMAETQRSAEW